MSTNMACSWLLRNVLVISITMMFCSAQPIFGYKGKLLPHDPHVVEGGTLNLTCNINQTAFDGTSKDLYFAVWKPLPYTSTLIEKEWSFDSQYITVLNDTALQLTVDNIGRVIHHFNVKCKVNVTDRKDVVISTQYVTVIFDPEPGMIQECIVEKNTMNCTWEPTHVSQSETMRHNVEDKLKWRLVGEKDWKDCPKKPKEGVCLWPPQNFTVDAEYEIFLNISTKFSHTISNTTIIKSRDIVKLPAIKKITLESLGKTSVALDWDSPMPHRSDIDYLIKYYRSNIGPDKDDNEEETSIDHTNVTLDELIPYTKYTFIVFSITEFGGYPSEPRKKLFTTHPDVPKRNPEVTSGSYDINDIADPNRRKITLFWKRIKPNEHYGPDFKYNVTVKSAGYSMVSETIDNLDSSPCKDPEKCVDRVEVTVPMDSAVTILVRSQNVLGISEGPTHPITIPANSQLLPGPDNFTAITTSENGKSVQLSWNEMRDNETTGFHVYWCLKKKKVCKVDEIHWKNLSSNSTSTIIQLPNDYDQYLFAVSREAGDTSSGLVWSDCTYQIHKYSPPPSWLSESIHVGHGELLLKWDTPKCHLHRGFIYKYLLTYCPTEGSSCPNDTDVIKEVEVPTNLTSFKLTGLDAHTRYCVTIQSLTAMGPSPTPSKAKCDIVTGTWLSPAVVAGFIIGGIFLAAVLVFFLFKFGKICMKVYHKFQTGVRVEMPHATYGPQNSVSSQRGLVEDDENYFLNDFPMGLAKQHSQESTADSGRGSLSQDHIRANLHRVSSGELDEVFRPPNSVGNGYQPGGRPISEPVSSYTRIAHASGGSTVSQPSHKTASLPRPKLPPRRLSPQTSPQPGGSSSRPLGYAAQQDSPGSGSMPSYVKVGDDSKGYAGPSQHQTDNPSISDLSSAPLSDYVKAQNNPDSGRIDPTYGKQMMGGQQQPIAPTGYVTVPENVKRNAGYITVPENVNQKPGGALAPGNVNQESCYVPFPETVNRNPEPEHDGHQPQNNTGYVLAPPVSAKQETPGNVHRPTAMQPGYVSLPVQNNPPNTSGYIAPPTQPANTGYVPAPGVGQQDAMTGYIPAPELARTAGSGLKPQPTTQSAPTSLPSQQTPNSNGYVTMPSGAGQVGTNEPIAQSTTPATGPVLDPPGIGKPSPSGYVTLPTSTVPPATQPALAGDAGQPDNVGYIQTPGGITPPLSVSTPEPYTTSNPYLPHPTQGPVQFHVPNTYTKDSVDYNRQQGTNPGQAGYVTLPMGNSSQNQPYVSVPDATVSTITPTQKPNIMNNDRDANHNSVNAYISPAQLVADSETSNFVTEPDHPTEGPPGEEEETHLLLPSNGGRKVLNKSGYVVVSP